MPQIQRAKARIGINGSSTQTARRRVERSPARRLRHINQVLSESKLLRRDNGIETMAHVRTTILISRPISLFLPPLDLPSVIDFYVLFLLLSTVIFSKSDDFRAGMWGVAMPARPLIDCGF
jgi:hypothetical protein